MPKNSPSKAAVRKKDLEDPHGRDTGGWGVGVGLSAGTDGARIEEAGPVTPFGDHAGDTATPLCKRGLLRRAWQQPHWKGREKGKSGASGHTALKKSSAEILQRAKP